MSWKASAHVKELKEGSNGEPLTRSEKLLLLVLADYYNEEQKCAWPSITTLAAEAMLSPRRTQELLRSAERKGVLIIHANTRDDGGSATNSYSYPLLDKGVQFSQGGRVRTSRGEGASSRGGRVRDGGNSPYIEPEVEPQSDARTTSNNLISDLQANPAYKEINVTVEYHKLVAWCSANNCRPTRRRFVNWLNRIEVPLAASPSPGLTVEEKNARAREKYYARCREQQARTA